MNIMIVSDDHGYGVFEEAYNDAVSKYNSIDMVLHAGDSEKASDDYYNRICDCPIYMVKGNNDFSNMPLEKIVECQDVRIFLTHGHRYGVYMGITNLIYAAKEKEAGIVIYGHTHCPFHRKAGDVEVINPGSLAGIRSTSKSYVILEINGNETKVDFNYLK